ncbi:hypothetical protein AMS68_005091 [Peltaster fructicola]|uniref:Fork-head domain-containing protein n=1 Tax=Peltaster fructicola TaxID=286661 RepID=A0A6H0XXW5_9PEZI|nr:hypothetical protein AMS68_005091 [Peltaster fructicola]
MDWLGHDVASRSPQRNLEEPALPSSFVMHDGTDWNTHIGSVFGDQLPRRLSSIDFSMSGYDKNDYSLTQEATSTCELPTFSHNAFALTSARPDEITLQDIIDADDQELLLNEHDDPWCFGRPVTEFTSYPSPPVRSNITHNEHQDDVRPERDASEGFEIVSETDPCYARLLWQCLREAPGHTLSLKDIYAWIRSHTQKARDPKNKGWQNSVRHNLSMNAAFERVANTSNGEGKKGSLWRLTEHAAEVGVISTTRYRRDPKRKPERRGLPAPKRQMSGAKGGAATRAAVHHKRLQEARARLSRPMNTNAHRHYTTTPESNSASPAHMMAPYPVGHPPGPYFINGPTSPTTNEQSPFSLSPCTPPAPLLPTHIREQKGHLRGFELSHLEYNTGLFSNVDTNPPFSPLSLTETNFYTDDAAFESNDPMLTGL